MEKQRVKILISLIVCMFIWSCVPNDANSNNLNGYNESSNTLLDNWVGEYTFSESTDSAQEAFMIMDYNIKIYKEDNQYYGEVRQVGQNCWIENKTKVIGNSEWVSLVMNECMNEKSYFQSLKDCVYISFRTDGEKIYTYWGFCESLLKENRQSGREYFVKTTYDSWKPSEMNNLKEWVGEYEYFDQDTNSDYYIEIFENEGDTCANIHIESSSNVEIEAEVVGNDEWIALICENNNVDLLEPIKDSVILYLKHNNDQILTYWGDKRFLSLITEDEMSYYKKNNYFYKK